MLRAVVFDLDDTLFPERAYVLSGFRAVAFWCEDKLGIRARRAFEEMSELLDSGMRRDTFNRLCEAHGEPQAAVSEMVGVYREHRPELAPTKESLSY
jgi:putative hydrolase of the HAD superfamily